MAHTLPHPYYDSQGITLYQGDCLELLSLMPEETFDMVFADPPYHLSNDGITCHAGKMVSDGAGNCPTQKESGDLTA